MQVLIDYSDERRYVSETYGSDVTVWDMAGGFYALGWIRGGIEYTASNYSGGLAETAEDFARDLQEGMAPGWLVIARDGQTGDELSEVESSLTLDGFVDAVDTAIALSNG